MSNRRVLEINVDVEVVVRDYYRAKLNYLLALTY